MSKVLPFRELITPLLEAYKQAVVKKNPNYRYHGPLLTTSKILVSSLNVDEALSEENLHYCEKEQGRSRIETLLICAIQLGIEQGINLCSEKPYEYLNPNDFDKTTKLLMDINRETK